MNKKLLPLLIIVCLTIVILIIVWLKPDEEDLKIKELNRAVVEQPRIAEGITNDIKTEKVDEHEVINIVKKQPLENEGFSMPNSVWEDRIIDGVTYTFGEGNPAEVALERSEYTGDGNWQNYVTPKVESLLKDFLTNENLKNFVDRCGSKLKINSSNSLSGFSITDSDELDINELLYIDSVTKRKRLNEDKMYEISQILYYVDNSLDGESQIFECMNGREIENFKKLHKTFDSMTEEYINQNEEWFYDQNDPEVPGYEQIQNTRKELGIAPQ